MTEWISDQEMISSVFDFIAHPVMMPTFEELCYMAPSMDKHKVEERLDRLIDTGIVKEVEPEDVTDDEHAPDMFYTLTDSTWETLTDNDLLGSQRTLRDMYSRVVKSEEIQHLEAYPRPDPEVDYDHIWYEQNGDDE